MDSGGPRLAAVQRLDLQLLFLPHLKEKGPVFTLASQSRSRHQKEPLTCLCFFGSSLTRILVLEHKWVGKLGFDNQLVMEKVRPLWSLTMS